MSTVTDDDNRTPPPDVPPTPEPESRGGWGALALLGLVILLAVLAGWRMSPPTPLGLDAPTDRFSAGRAQVELEAFMGVDASGASGEDRPRAAPRPVGSRRQLAARQWLVERLRELGWTVREETRRAVLPGLACDLVNVIAEWPGTDPDASGVWLAAHHDSVHAGPGAADDAAGVAALVEIARVLAAEGPRRRTIRLLITDGEEQGLLGARVEASSLPVGDAVVNLEARGTSGPSLIFETSPNDAAIVRHIAEAVPRPVTSSAFAGIYRRMPNDTDFTIFTATGMRGVNLAFIGDVQRYHTPLDDLAYLDLGSVQQQGDTTLALARSLADTDEGLDAEADAVFFDVLGWFVVRWPSSWRAWPALLAWLLVLAGGWKARNAGDTVGVGEALLRSVARVALVLVAGGGMAVVTATVLPAWGVAAFPSDLAMATAAFVGPSLATALLAVAVLERRSPDRSGTAFLATHGVVGLVAVVGSLSVPTLVYPLVVLAFSAALGGLLPMRLRAVGELLPVVAWGLVVLPHTLLLPGALGLADGIALATVLPWLLLVVVALPILVREARPTRLVRLSSILLFLALVHAGHATMDARYDRTRPGHLNLIRHVTVAEDGSREAVVQARPFRGVEMPETLTDLGFAKPDGNWLFSDPTIPTSDPAPRIEVIQEEPGTRRLTVRLIPARADSFLTLLAPEGVVVRLDGREWDGRGRGLLRRRYLTPPADGVDLELELPGNEPVGLVLQETLPQLRPLDVATEDSALGDVILARNGASLIGRGLGDRTIVTVRRQVAPAEKR